MVDEILQRLLANELLSEDTKAELTEQWTTSVDAFKTQVKEEVTKEVRLELSEQYIAERDELIAKVDEFVTEALKNEVSELHGDIERFRDLEVESAEKLVEEKHRLAAEVAEELDQLVDKIDAFFEVRLAAEMEELKEDLAVVKQNEFGKAIFEAFAQTYSKTHIDEDSVQAQLEIAEAKLAEVEDQLQEAKQARDVQVRESKLDKLLGNLAGTKREQMEMVLKNVETGRLEESYKFFIGRILKEETSVKPVISEGTEVERKTTVVTGDRPVENVAPVIKEDLDMKRLQRLAGIN